MGRNFPLRLLFSFHGYGWGFHFFCQKLKHKLKSGQSVVEYILLLGVVIVIALGIIKSSTFKKLFGNESVVFDRYRRSIEHSYRHGYGGFRSFIINDRARYQEGHTSYFQLPEDEGVENEGGVPGETHFFFNNQPYGTN